MRGRVLALVVALDALSWVSTGVATWMLIESLSDRAPPSVAWLVGAYAFASLLGFLATHSATGVATALGLTLRLANTLGEFAAILVVEAVYRLRGGRRYLQRVLAESREDARGA